MKIAVLIGVSDYTKLNPLTICENDLKIMSNLLKDVAKYDVLSISSLDFNALETKEKLSDFINQNKDKTVDELFFYFSGHGNYENEEFYYLLKDYSPDKKNQTSISNSDIDNMFKSLKPKLMIKVVDACNSGIPYIKSSDDNCIKKYLEDTSKTYNNCYFMFSSQRNQISLISGNPLSDFTYSFINSIIKTNTSIIKYKHIIDYISDDFSNNKNQTPYFIAQADYTENFLNITNAQKKELENEINIEVQNEKLSDIEIINNDNKKTKSLIDYIVEDNERYVEQETAFGILNNVFNNLANSKLSDELNSLYEIKLTNADINTSANTFGILEQKNIGKWLKENKHDLFAKPIYKEEEYTTTKKVPIKSWATIISGRYDQYEEKEVTKTREVISSFIPTIEQPFYMIKMYLKPLPKYQNIKPFDLTCACLMSKTKLQIFYYYVSYNEFSWGQYNPKNEAEWKIRTIDFIQEKQQKIIVDEIVKEFENFVLASLKNDFGYKENSVEREDDTKKKKGTI